MLTTLRNGLTTLVIPWVHDCTCPRIVPKAFRPTSARISTLHLSSHQQIRLLNCSWTAPFCKTSTKRHQHKWTFRIRNPAHLFWTLCICVVLWLVAVVICVLGKHVIWCLGIIGGDGWIQFGKRISLVFVLFLFNINQKLYYTVTYRTSCKIDPPFNL